MDGLVLGGALVESSTAGLSASRSHTAVLLSGRVARVVATNNSKHLADGHGQLDGLVGHRLSDDMRGDGEDRQGGGGLEKHLAGFVILGSDS